MEEKNLLGERLSKALVIMVVVASLFLLVKTGKEMKLYGYVGRDAVTVPQISVTGLGEAIAVPDIATFTFTVSKESPTVGVAQEDVNNRTTAILAFLEDNGVAEKDIKTMGYNIYPVYDYSPCVNGWCPPDRGRIRGYEVSQTMEVKVRVISDSGKLVSGVGELGATNLSGLSFMVDDDEAVKAEARAMAIEDAQSKAKILAKDLGVSLVRIVSFSENSRGYPPVPYYAKNEVLGMGGDMAVMESAVLPAGENEYAVQVNILYEIR